MYCERENQLPSACHFLMSDSYDRGVSLAHCLLYVVFSGHLQSLKYKYHFTPFKPSQCGKLITVKITIYLITLPSRKKELFFFKNYFCQLSVKC